MNDALIRENLHKKLLYKYHAAKNTRVIDELGLNHGRNRADIVVVNGILIGYEIKSDCDSLSRLDGQIKSYNAIFDGINVIVGSRYLKKIHTYVPPWWGIIVALNQKNKIEFDFIRKASRNNNVQSLAIARLLWRNEVIELLKKKNVSSKLLRQPRAILYEAFADLVHIDDLRRSVREVLKNRENWRGPALLSQYDDSCQPVST